MTRREPEDRPLNTFTDDPAEPTFDNVTCPDCGNEQWDAGPNMDCLMCGRGSMPYHDNDGNLVED